MMLRDLEELLLVVHDIRERDFLGEAVRCYHGGAYRGAVVMAVAAGMDGLRARLEILAKSKGASASLKGAVKQITKKYTSQDCYERECIDCAREYAGLISPAEGDRLTQIFGLRNKCAHPSGYSASAEDARAAIAAMVDLILARPAVFGFVRVEELIQALVTPIMFPKGVDNTLVVERETHDLSELQLPALAERLMDTLSIAAAKTSQYRNAAKMLSGLAVLGGARYSAIIGSRALSRTILAGNAAAGLLSLTCAAPGLLGDVHELDRFRLLELVRLNLGSSAGRRALSKLVKSKIMNKSERRQMLNAAEALYIEPWDAEAGLGVVADTDWDALGQQFFGHLVARCGDSTFVVAKSAIEFVQKLDSKTSSLVPSELRAAYILNCADAARWGTWAAEELVKNGLGPRSDFIDALKAVSADNPDAVVARSLRSLEELSKLLRASGRMDVVETVLDAVEKLAAPDLRPAVNSLLALSNWSEVTIATSAKSLLKLAGWK